MFDIQTTKSILREQLNIRQQLIHMCDLSAVPAVNFMHNYHTKYTN